jgi:hypothetical protein
MRMNQTFNISKLQLPLSDKLLLTFTNTDQEIFYEY